MKTLAFRRSSPVEPPYLVLVHAREAPDVEEWRAYVDAVAETMASAVGRVNVFVATDGGGPNPAQRKALANAFNIGKGDAWTYVFTTDAFVRGVVTAFNWVSKVHATAHMPSEFPNVCHDCGLSAFDVMKEFNELHKTFQRVNTLVRISEAVQRSTTRKTQR
jgi:hypothetical protein